MDAQFYVVELNQSSCVDRDSSGPFWEQKNNDSKDFLLKFHENVTHITWYYKRNSIKQFKYFWSKSKKKILFVDVLFFSNFFPYQMLLLRLQKLHLKIVCLTIRLSNS